MVITKKEISRNEAEFRNNEELFADIKRSVKIAIESEHKVRQMSFPSIIEKSSNVGLRSRWDMQFFAFKFNTIM